MGMIRKGNPRFRQGVDSLGRKAWLRNGRVDASAMSGLRAGLTTEAELEPPVSKLQAQLSPTEAAIVFSEARDAGGYAVKRPEYVYPEEVMLKRLIVPFVGSAAAATTVLVAPAASLLLLPILVAIGAGVAAPFINRWWRRRSAEKEHIKKRISPLTEYRDEARRFATSFPHRNGVVTAFKQKAEARNRFRIHEVESSVDGSGVGEVKWKRLYAGSGDEESSGSLALYPGVDLRGMELPFPLHVPNVNMRYAGMRGVVLAEGGTMDGADFRGVDAANSTWKNVSLRGATFAGANLSGAYMSLCDVDGVDFTGADLTDAKLPRDLTGTNITAEQFDSLFGMGPEGEGTNYIVKEASFDEVVAALGGDQDTVTVAMWAGDVEVRDRQTNKVVTGEYNPDAHYIPRWSLETSVYA